MAKGPDRPPAPQARNPAKHSKKDPAKPTRAKAARPVTPALDPSLAELLNPGIAQGRAGIGAQTGNTSPQRGEQRRRTDAVLGEKNADAKASAVRAKRDRVRGIEAEDRPPSPGHSGRPLPPGERPHEARGLQQPPDNSWDPRADLAPAHRARASVARGFGAPPQQSYVGRTPVSPGELDPDLARSLGIEEEEASSSPPPEVEVSQADT